MVVICVAITASSEQIVSGIPKTVSITTNVPATIFYTLDGSQPTLYSSMYVSPIFLPYTQFTVILNVMATDGTNFSPIISETYQTNIVDGNARLPHAATTARAAHITPPDYPFGTPPFQPKQGYLNPADSGVTVYNPELPAIPNAYDADGYSTAFSNRPFNSLNYQIPYSTTNAEGEMGPGIGTLPSNVYYPAQLSNGLPPAYDGEQTEQFTATFDPRAFVIFQNFSEENPEDPPQINRANFTLENTERARDGVYYFNSGPDGAPPPSGTFVRQHYNPRTNEMTYYYRDSWSNQWIISTAPFVPNGNFDGNLAVMPIAWSGRIIEWSNPSASRYHTLI